MMTKERKIENLVGLTDTLWQVNKYKMIKEIEKASGHEVPEACYELMEWCYRYGAMHMERTIGKAAH